MYRRMFIIVGGHRILDLTTLTLIAAEKKQHVCLVLPASEAGDVLNVGHLADELCVETGIDLWNQVIIFKGR